MLLFEFSACFSLFLTLLIQNAWLPVFVLFCFFIRVHFFTATGKGKLTSVSTNPGDPRTTFSICCSWMYCLIVLHYVTCTANRRGWKAHFTLLFVWQIKSPPGFESVLGKDHWNHPLHMRYCDAPKAVSLGLKRGLWSSPGSSHRTLVSVKRQQKRTF